MPGAEALAFARRRLAASTRVAEAGRFAHTNVNVGKLFFVRSMIYTHESAATCASGIFAGTWGLRPSSIASRGGTAKMPR